MAVPKCAVCFRYPEAIAHPKRDVTYMETHDFRPCSHPVKAMRGNISTFECLACGETMSFLEAVGEQDTEGNSQ